MCNNNNSSSSSGFGGGLRRKGPWTEQEDAQLVWLVRLFGERRWDFLAKVSGLKRTGKSCRLRWVNYLHPGLKRSRITPDEERLILQLYAQWGSRWSRIARKLPGRTDNEIKNYWRTHTRKKAQEEKKKKKKRAAAPASTSFSSMSTRTTTSCSASLNNGTTATSSTSAVTTEAPQESTSGDEAEEATTAASQHQHQHQHQPQEQEQEQEHYYSMDQLWNEIAAAEAAATSYAEGWGSAGHVVAAEPAASMPSPVWELCADYSLWRIDDEEYYKRCSMLHDAYHLSY